MIKELLKKEYINLNLNAKNKLDALKQISILAYEQDVVTSSEAYYQGLIDRENEVTTGFGNGIAIPHARIEEVKKAAIFFVTFKEPITWESLDDKPVRIAFVLAMPSDDIENRHLKVLALLSRKLMHEEFRENLLKSTSIDEILKVLDMEEK